MIEPHPQQPMAPQLSKLIFGNASEQDWAGKLTGHLPDWVAGSFYLNGPGAYIRGELHRGHWIDGDGLVRRLAFADGKAQFRSRYVHTQRRTDELSGHPPYRSFGTATPDDRLRRGMTLYSPANVSVHPIGKKLFAFGEQSLPWQLDPVTLETIGEYDFDGRFSEIMPLSAHPKLDAANGHMCNFGAIYLPTSTRFHYLEWDSALTPKIHGEAELSSADLVHDCLISEHYAAFHLSPYSLNIRRFLIDGDSLYDAMQWDKNTQGSWLIFSRQSGEMLAKISTAGESFSLHTINAYEQGNELILDTIQADQPYYDQYLANPGLFSNIGATTIRRTRLETNDWHVIEDNSVKTSAHLDFPCLAANQVGQPYRHAWLLGMPIQPKNTVKFYDHLVRFDWKEHAIVDTYNCPRNSFLGGEPQFLAEPGKDGSGVLMCQEINMESENTNYLFFDAFHLHAGPIARVTLPFFDPPAFHTALGDFTL